MIKKTNDKSQITKIPNSKISNVGIWNLLCLKNYLKL